MKKLGELTVNLLTYFKRPRAFPVRQIVPLTAPERKRFREIIQEPVFQRVIENAYAKKPSVAAQNTGCTNPSELAANNRLHQLQGWEMLEAAIFAQAEEPIVKKTQYIEETYPDAGTRIGE